MKFFIQCTPPKSTHQGSMRIMKRKDGTQFVGKFASSKGRKAQDELTALFMPHKPSKPMEGPLMLNVAWCYPWRKAEKKSNKEKQWMWCDTRPDCSNLIKIPEDILTRLGFVHDDSQFAKIVFSKFWGDHPGIAVEITPL
jgi:Holliday junction resolvase RusA-like endonuclease